MISGINRLTMLLMYALLSSEFAGKAAQRCYRSNTRRSRRGVTEAALGTRTVHMRYLQFEHPLQERSTNENPHDIGPTRSHGLTCFLLK